MNSSPGLVAECAVSNVIPIAPIDLMMVAALSAGWPPKKAFEASMQLLLHGCTVPEVREMFNACERWRQ